VRFAAEFFFASNIDIRFSMVQLMANPAAVPTSHGGVHASQLVSSQLWIFWVSEV
jgi:hypothetical protein